MKRALIVSCFNWYESRIKPIREILCKEYDVTILVSDYDHIKKSPVKNKYNECTYIAVPEYKKNLSVQRVKSHIIFGKAVRKYLYLLEPEVIFVQLPPNNIGIYCVEFKKENPKTKLYVDLIDLWPESMPIKRFRRFLPVKVWKEWRDKCIKEADYVFTECRLYQKKLADVLQKEKTDILYLFKEQNPDIKSTVQKIIEEKEQSNKVVREISFAYLGSMNNIIDIDGICSVIEGFVNLGYKVRLHAIGCGENEENFRNRVNKTGCISHFYGALYDEETKVKILAPCDYAFNMMKNTVEVGLTIKSIDYFSMGLPIINNIKGDTWSIVDIFNMGINYDIFNNFDIEKIVNTHINRKKLIINFENLFSKEAFIEKVKRVIITN